MGPANPKDYKSIQPDRKHRGNYVDAKKQSRAESRMRREMEQRKRDEQMDADMARGWEHHQKNRVK